MIKAHKSEAGRIKLHNTYDRLLGMWGVDYEESLVDTRYGATHIITAGGKDSPPLLLFHGVGDDSALMWVFNARVWAKQFHIIAIDTMGGPGKSMPNENYGKGFEQVLWIDDILNALQLSKVFLAGVSYGAAIVQLYAVKRPNVVEKAVCMAGGLLAKVKSNRMLLMMKVFLPEALMPNEKNIKKLLRKLCGKNTHVFEEDEILMKHWRQLIQYANSMAISRHRLVPFEDDEMDLIRKKILFLIGDRDPIAYSDKSLEVLERYHMRYEIFSDVGHAINHEISDEINTKVTGFLLS